MKRTYFLISLLFCLTAAVSCSKNPSRKPDSALRVVPLVGIGKVRFGMSEQEVVQTLGKPDKKKPRSLMYLSRGFTVGVDGKGKVFSLNCFSKKAIPWWSRFSANDFRGATKEGIKIGSSEQQIIEAYGRPDERSEQGRQVDLTYKALGLHFIVLSDRLIQFSMTGQ